MPWNDNKGGGGGWTPGGGGRGPWGQGPGNGGGRGQGPNIRPPDLDELYKRAREWMKRMFPNQSPFGIIFSFGGAILFFLWFLTGVYIIQQPEQGVVLRFGKFVEILQPGLHLRFPQPIETVIRQNVQQARQVNVGFSKDPDNDAAAPTNVPHESLMLTGDENIVDIDFTVFWKIRDAKDFSFQVADPEDTIKAIAESAMREAVGQEKIGIAQTGGRGDLEDKVRTIMQTALDGYKAGVTITKVNVQKVDPPAEVIDSFRDVQAALQDKVRKQNDATKYANSVVPRARGEASKIVQDAEAYKQQQIAEAKGEAQRFLSIYDQYRNSKDVTRERMFLETMQRVLGSTNKVIIQSGSNAPPIMMPYLPLPELRRSQTPSVPAPSPGANP